MNESSITDNQFNPSHRAASTLTEGSSSAGSETSNSQSAKQVFAMIFVFVIGAYLGFLFSKSEVARWERIHKMFLFQEAYMYLIISVAILVAMISMAILKSIKARSLDGEPITYTPKPFQWGVVIGGMCFGAGWAIAGACPGPIYAQVGGGAWIALFTFAGALCGTTIYAALKPKLPH